MRVNALGEPGTAAVSLPIIAAGLGAVALAGDHAAAWFAVAVVGGSGVALAVGSWKTRTLAWALSIGAGVAFLGGSYGV